MPVLQQITRDQCFRQAAASDCRGRVGDVHSADELNEFCGQCIVLREKRMRIFGWMFAFLHLRIA